MLACCEGRGGGGGFGAAWIQDVWGHGGDLLERSSSSSGWEQAEEVVQESATPCSFGIDNEVKSVEHGGDGGGAVAVLFIK